MTDTFYRKSVEYWSLQPVESIKARLRACEERLYRDTESYVPGLSYSDKVKILEAALKKSRKRA